MRRDILLFVLISGAILAACGGDEGDVHDTQVAESTQPDLVGVDTTDTSAEVETDSGSYMKSCTQASDCGENGVCFHYLDPIAGICTDACDAGSLCEEPGWSCKAYWKGDDALFCFPDDLTLCQPCASDGDCLWKNRCKDYGEEGSFCASPCAGSADCPWGYYCDVDQLCKIGTGVCACNGWGAANNKNTLCYKENLNGECEGLRSCGDDGALTDCNAATPAYEKCNGKDDNCDGEIDEGICDDGNPCTQDICDPENDGACSHDAADMEGLPCDADGDGCTSDDACLAGACTSGVPVDCSDISAGCMVGVCESTGKNSHVCKKQPAPDQAPCDDQDPCTLGDVCVDGDCAAGEPVDCDDNDPCTIDSCDPLDGTCVHDPGGCEDGGE